MTDSRINTILDEALLNREKGDLALALQTVKPLLSHAPRKASVAGILGTLFFENEQWAQAAHWYEVATKLKPDAERASLGLFHSLWHLDKRREALQEMARFRAAHRSAEYDTLHREMTEEFLEYMAYMNGAQPTTGRPPSASRWKSGRKGAKTNPRAAMR